MRHRIFVYGTLKTDQSNSTLLWSSTYLGPEAIDGYRMYDLGMYPVIVKTGISEEMVGGEVWEVSDGTMEVIDKLEGLKGDDYQNNPYNKELVNTNYGEAFVYALNIVDHERLKYPIVSDGNWDAGVRSSTLLY
jgi:gamma-glutamylcyclotransferase (GGCT)/AIG2-like uncharacterized protein YtfP